MSLSWRIRVAGVAALLTIMASGAHARPTFGNDCTSCHDRSAGAFSVLPSNLIEIAWGEMGEVTFDVTELGSAGEDSALAVYGLDDADLEATPDLTGWNVQDGGTFLSSDFFNAVGQVPLSIGIGTSAALGDYLINVTLAGGPGSDWSTTSEFTIRVIPEPTTIVLLGIGLISGAMLIGNLRRRRKGA